MEQKPFKFKSEPKDIHLVDSWQIGVRDGLFLLGLGLKTDPANNEGEILYSVVMTPQSAKMMYQQLGNILNPPNQPPEDSKNRLK